MSTPLSTTGRRFMPLFAASLDASSTDVSDPTVIRGEVIISFAFTSLASLFFNRTFKAMSRSVIMPAGLPSAVITTLPTPSSSIILAILMIPVSTSSLMTGLLIISRIFIFTFSLLSPFSSLASAFFKC